jgi:hypothetical protein
MVLSTQFIKCTVAASLAVHEEQRPDLQIALAKIAFGVDRTSSSDNIKAQWHDLKNFKATGATWRDDKGNEDRTSREICHCTFQMKAKLMTRTSEDGKKYLLIDKVLHDALKTLKPSPHNFSSPVSCINYGNSPSPDGFVTFYIIKERASEPIKFTIMNHSKDYNNSKLDSKRLRTQAESGQLKLLDPHFGECRLLCVSSSKAVLFSSNCTNARDFIPDCVDKSMILKSLLRKLESQRARKQWLETHAYWCDEDGVQINPI